MYQYFSQLIPIKSCQKCRRDNDFIVVSNMSNKIMYLNNTAADFYDLCNGHNTVNEIIAN